MGGTHNLHTPWGHNTSEFVNPETHLADLVINDVAKCLICEKVGLWGDKCNESQSAYLNLMAACKLCHGHGYAGMPCYRCTERDPNQEESVFEIPLKATLKLNHPLSEASKQKNSQQTEIKEEDKRFATN